MHMSLDRRTAGTMLAAGLLLAACGGSSDDAADEAPLEASITAPTTTVDADQVKDQDQDVETAEGFDHVDLPAELPLVNAGTAAEGVADEFAASFFVGREYVGALEVTTLRPPEALGLGGPSGPPQISMVPLSDATVFIEGSIRVGIQSCDDAADGPAGVAELLESGAGPLGADFPTCESSGFVAILDGFYGMDRSSSTLEVELPVVITFWDDRPFHYAGLTAATVELALDDNAITGSVHLGTEEYHWRAIADSGLRQLLVVNDGPFEELFTHDGVTYARNGSIVSRLESEGSVAWETDLGIVSASVSGVGSFIVATPFLGEGGLPDGDLVVIDTATGDIVHSGSPLYEAWTILALGVLEDGSTLAVARIENRLANPFLVGLDLPGLSERWQAPISEPHGASLVGDEIWTNNDHGAADLILSAIDGTRLGQPFYGSSQNLTFTDTDLVGYSPDREVLWMVDADTGSTVLTLDPGYGTDVRSEGISWNAGFDDVIEYDGRWWTNLRLNYENGNRPSWISEYEFDGTRLETTEACQGSFHVTELGLFHGPTMIASTHPKITPPARETICSERADQDIQSEVVHPESGMWGLRGDGSLVRFGIGPGFLQIPDRPA